jgi:1,4-dihydroxy-2-naphthoyl-CoA hydrolase
MVRPVSGGTVRAVAAPLHRGRTTVTVQTSLYDSEQRLVAQTTQIQVVRPAVSG